jgi:hypothetical protein
MINQSHLKAISRLRVYPQTCIKPEVMHHICIMLEITGEQRPRFRSTVKPKHGVAKIRV